MTIYLLHLQKKLESDSLCRSRARIVKLRLALFVPLLGLLYLAPPLGYAAHTNLPETSDKSEAPKAEGSSSDKIYFSLYAGISDQYSDADLDVAKSGLKSSAPVYSVLGRYSWEKLETSKAVVTFAGFTTYALGFFYRFSNDTVNATLEKQDLHYEAKGIEFTCRYSAFHVQDFNAFIELGLYFESSLLVVKSDLSNSKLPGYEGLGWVGNPSEP